MEQLQDLFSNLQRVFLTNHYSCRALSCECVLVLIIENNNPNLEEVNVVVENVEHHLTVITNQVYAP